MSFEHYEEELDLSGTTGADDLKLGYESVLEGTYHVGVRDVTMNPTDGSGNYINGAWFSISLEIFAGEPNSEVKKKFSLMFFRPDPNKEKWKFEESRAMAARLGKATLVIPAEVYGKPVPVVWLEMVGKHFVIEVYRSKSGKTDKEGYLRVKGIWHVASPDVAKFVNEEVAREFPMGPDTMPPKNNGAVPPPAPSAPPAVPVAASMSDL